MAILAVFPLGAGHCCFWSSFTATQEISEAI
ncbi:MAG: hypothetical protein ACI9G1_002514 [Pirellulaceae bacterium]|jgi:hypothetical protein